MIEQIWQREEGTKQLVSFIRTWCDLKLWHVQFNVVNKDTLVEGNPNIFMIEQIWQTSSTRIAEQVLNTL